MFLVHLGVHSAEKKYDASKTIKEEYDKALCDEMSKHKNRLEIHDLNNNLREDNIYINDIKLFNKILIQFFIF